MFANKSETMLKKTFLLTIFAISAIVCRAMSIDQMVLTGKRISTANGLSSNTVYDMAQDNDGFIWMGAAYGLCRYDGYSFVNYLSLSSDKNRNIDANIGNIHCDSSNRLLWIHTATLTFACYDLTAGRFVDYTRRGDENRTYRRFIKNGSDLWMYDDRSGIRHVSCQGGNFKCTDYTVQNGRLPGSHIPRMVADGKGNVWAATDNGLLRIDRQGRLTTIAKGQRYKEANTYRGDIVCLTESNTVEIYSPDGKKAKSFKIPSAVGNVNAIKSNFVWRGRWMLFCKDTYQVDLNTGVTTKPDGVQVPNGLLLDTADGYHFESNSSGTLWVFTPEGEVKTLKLLPDVKFTTDRMRRYTVRRGPHGLFYIATFGNGLFVYDHRSGALRHYSANDPQPVIDSNFLTTMFIDRDGTLWVAQDMMGVACISVADQSIADFVLPAKGHKGDWANNVKMIAKRSDGKTIFSTRDNKIYALDAEMGQATLLYETKACAYSYITDSRGREWMATRGDGLYVDGTGYNKGDRRMHCPSNDLYDMKEDKQGRVWIATYEDGLLMAQTDNGGRLSFRRLLDRSTNESRLHQIEIDAMGRIWVGSNNGLYVADTNKKDLTNDDFKCFNTKDGSFPFDEVRCLEYTSDGHLWAGGKGCGVVRCTFGKGPACFDLKILTDREGLANNSICSILEDNDGNIWVATESGLSLIYDHDMKVKTFQFGKMPQRNIYSEGSAMLMGDGRLLFGTQYGLTIVSPRLATKADRADSTHVYITDIEINGVSASDSGRFERAPGHVDRVSLRHNENTVKLSFSNFEYSNIESSLYQFYLEGADKGWRQMTSVNHVEYTNLPPGTYIFHLRSLSDNVWSEETQLAIVVHHPWYNTWWAWVIYLMVAAAFGLYVYNNAREKLRLHQRMKLEKQMAEFRLNFFTNVTHEFRTPLAIIQGAVDKLADHSDRPPSKAALQTARRGTKRLLKLVNQLMEFRKVNTGNMRLSVERADIIAFVRDIYQDFWSLAHQKRQQITFTPFAKSHEMEFDRQMVEAMVYNLLSNAVKYTPERGAISLSVRLAGNSLEIVVEDSGPGISAERRQLMFKPFMGGYASQGGMGIGLYNAYQMALLHKGTLTYSPGANGGGSVFTISLPATGDAYTDGDRRKAIDTTTTGTEKKNDKCEQIIKELVPKAFNDVTIAVIEDDPDMRQQTESEMGVYFHIDSYATGEAGLDGVAARKPALVICDVMLPDISGYDIVKHLKTNIETADIPVIMLTALDDDAHKLKSYNAGADDYMVKPCNFRLLTGRAAQLIKNAQKAKRRATQDNGHCDTPAAQADEIRLIMSPADKKFIDRMDALIMQNISAPDFTVTALAEMLYIGRSKFFKKVKELTGVSPNKYLLNKRMELAAELLLEGRLNVTEVSYKVGIIDASYFNKCFKAKYGVSPKQYGKGKP